MRRYALLGFVFLVAGCSQGGCGPSGGSQAEVTPADREAAEIHRQVARLGDRRDDVRLTARFELMRRGRAAEPALLEALAHSDPVVRYEASAALRSMTRFLGEEALAPLEQAVRDVDGRVRDNAVQILGALGPRAKPAAGLLHDALHDPNRRVARDAVGALGQVLEVEAVPELIGLLRSADLNLSAAIALGKLGPDAARAIPALEEMARMGGAPEKEAAVSALQCLRGMAPESE